MSGTERMTVLLTEPDAAELRAAVAAGEYASTSEALHEAVRLWSDRRQARTDDVEPLRRAWDVGAASPTCGPLSFSDLRREARERLSAARAAGPAPNRESVGSTD